MPNAHMIGVDVMLQDELESGCEIYSAVTLLHYYGFEIDEFDFIEKYLTTEPERLIGIAEFYNYEEKKSKASIGCRLHDACWGKGIATEVVALMRDYLTEDVGRTFQKLGARYHFARAGGLFAGLDMRAHQMDRSYSLEWSLGYSF